jgi:outer membrane protein
MSRCFLFILVLLTVGNIQALAGDPQSRTVEEKRWMVGFLTRSASIPFATEDKTVATLVPLIHYEGDTFFFRTLEGGFKVYQTGPWQFSLLGRLRFFDIPAEFQNEIQGDQTLWGAQARYSPFGPWHLDVEFMTDADGRTLGNLRAGSRFESRLWEFNPFIQLQTKSSDFNSRYYGLDQENVSGGSELGLGFTAGYHLVSHLHLFAAGSLTRLDKPVRQVEFVDRNYHWQAYLGFGLGNKKEDHGSGRMLEGSYLRLAHGWATPSSLAQIIRFNADDDPYNNQLTSVFYGHPVSETLVGLPIEVYLHSGLVWHWKSEVQDSAQEIAVSIKLYYTFPLPVRVRLGAAEGLDWVNNIPYVEETQLGKKGYQSSNLLNFLDLSLDLNLGDIVGKQEWKRWWLGYNIHHRSAIFETAQQFGRIKGGSNFQAIYLQRDF